MYYTIYKITNVDNGFVYIGQHVTDDLDDGYMGSGLRLSNAYKIHGTDSFIKEILHVFDNFDDMDQKEAELVNEEFIRRSDVYNIVLGGSGWCAKGTVVVEDLRTPGNYMRIPKESYDPQMHRYPTSGSIQVYLKSTGEKLRIPIDEYHSAKHLYNTPSKGRVSVRCISTGKTYSIPTEEFDPNEHVKVLGGIVVNKNGVNQYVSKDEFVSQGLKGIHAGKVTVFDNLENVMKHISSEEYHADKDRYVANGTGMAMVFNKETGKRCRIPKSDVEKNPDRYVVGTTGWLTVYDMETKKFTNVPKGTFDSRRHKRAQDRKIICYNKEGNVKFEFWGGKTEFLETYNCSESVWNATLKETVFYSNHPRSKEFDGCRFTLVEWKP